MIDWLLWLIVIPLFVLALIDLILSQKDYSGNQNTCQNLTLAIFIFSAVAFGYAFLAYGARDLLGF